MKTIFTTGLALVLVPIFAAAQDSDTSRVEIRGSGGWIGFADDSMINHGLVGVSARIRLVRGLGVEPEFSYLIGPDSDRDITLIPLVSYEFGKGRVKPYVIGGVGVLWHKDGFYRSFSSEGYHASAGFGVRTPINHRWSVSPEFRVGWYFHMQAKVSVGYRF
jgi:outer membrane protein with beta-barrel domain